MFSDSQNGETALSSPSIGSVHSMSEDYLRTPRTENITRSELLSQGSNMFSTDSQLSPTTDSLEDSLDSDMLSISGFSDSIELLDP